MLKKDQPRFYKPDLKYMGLSMLIPKLILQGKSLVFCVRNGGEIEIINEREGSVDLYRDRLYKERWKGRQVEFSEI